MAHFQTNKNLQIFINTEKLLVKCGQLSLCLVYGASLGGHLYSPGIYEMVITVTGPWSALSPQL